MKNNKKLIKGSNTNTLLRKTFERNKMIPVKNTKMFLSFLGKLSWRVVLLSTMTTLKGASARVKMIHNFGRYLVNCNRKHGPDWVIAYLKASQLALSKYIAGEPLGSLMEVNPDYIFPRLASGIPKIIGPRDRVSIRYNQRKVVILWMSIFGLFRILAGTYKLKISTITNPFVGDSQFLAEKSISMAGITRDALRALPWTKKNSRRGLSAIIPNRLLLMTTSSPSSKVSWKGLILDVRNLRNMGLSDPMIRWMTILNSPLLKHFKNILNVALPILEDGRLMGRTAARVAYVRSSEVGVEMVRLLRLTAISKSSGQKPEEMIIPRSSIHKLVWAGEQTGKPDFAYPTLISLRKKDPWIFKESWIVQDTVIIPFEYVQPDHEVLFITKPITPLEKEAATYQTELLTALHKNEYAEGQVGQVQFVKEAAGKLRVFAMVDVWTQSIMQPVHKLLTSFLRDLPNDGTLNQTLSYERARQKSIQYGCSYGYDLSAATDRLPIVVQKSILRGLFQSIGISTNLSIELSDLWAEILVKRPFLVPKLPKGVEDPQELEFSHVYYEVGQPMGALSSFNMLALTHHMIVQDIWQSLGGKGWCEMYEITGDDIVLFDPQLASYYLDYMKSLGLEINQKKSVVSVRKACGEYLKKTWIKDTDVSMISWKQLYQNHSTLMGRISDSLYFCQKWDSLKLGIIPIVRRTALTWPGLQSSSREVVNVPLLALMSTALRQSRLPLEKFFLFLLKPGEAWFEFKTLYSKISNIKINQQEVVDFLSSFFGGKGIVIPDTRDWTRRRLALSGPFTGLRGGLIDKIVALQDKIHGEVAVVLPKLTKEELSNYPAKIRMELVYTEVQPQKPFNTMWAFRNMELLEKAVLGSQYLFISFRNNKTWIISEFLHECVIMPAFEKSAEIICKTIPNLRPGQPWLDRELLQNLDITQLLTVLDALISLESVLTAHVIEDEDRRVAHKASLSVLKTLKPTQFTPAQKIVDTTPMSKDWERMPGRLRREILLSMR